MNNERRKAIASVQSEIEQLQEQISSIQSQLEDIRDEEQEFYDNMPESFQNGEKGDIAQQAVEQLDNAISELEGFDTDSIASYLEEAQA